MHFVVSHEYNIFQKISKIALAGYQNGAKKASFYFVIVKLERNVQNFHRNICCYQLLLPNLQKIKRPWFVDEKNIYQREKQSLFWTFQHGKSTLFVLFFGNDKKMTIFDNVRLKNNPYFCFVKDEKRVKTEDQTSIRTQKNQNTPQGHLKRQSAFRMHELISSTVK